MPFQRKWLAGTVNFVYIVVDVLSDHTYRIRTDVKDVLDNPTTLLLDRLVSREAAGLYCRQLASFERPDRSVPHRRTAPPVLGRAPCCCYCRARALVSAPPGPDTLAALCRPVSLPAPWVLAPLQAIHADVACFVHRKMPNNRQERLAQIKSIRKGHVAPEAQEAKRAGTDFTQFV